MPREALDMLIMCVRRAGWKVPPREVRTLLLRALERQWTLPVQPTPLSYYLDRWTPSPSSSSSPMCFNDDCDGQVDLPLLEPLALSFPAGSLRLARICLYPSAHYSSDERIDTRVAFSCSSPSLVALVRRYDHQLRLTARHHNLPYRSMFCLDSDPTCFGWLRWHGCFFCTSMILPDGAKLEPANGGNPEMGFECRSVRVGHGGKEVPDGESRLHPIQMISVGDLVMEECYFTIHGFTLVQDSHFEAEVVDTELFKGVDYS